ncbi:hypothetical protein QBC40DRAFT_353547 [Triangularia verruculosa]|uniref:Uncharacterized protein n=1 Tax=Triangularia verruculosa TaxID=2587418 RepID=A0AAN6X515_9PEZI|nr:hypothetical protein QBC40DRAFT_353547 [Triangularia verruculosa]
MAYNEGPELLNPEEIACPLEGRRGDLALSLKFAVLTITILTFYCRFIQTRDRTNISFTPILFYFAPLNFVFKYVVGITSILSVHAIQRLLAQYRPDPDWTEMSPNQELIRALRHLFGKIPRRTYSSLSTVITSDDGPALRHSTSERNMGIIGSVFVTLMFIAQCIGTIILYFRRIHHDAVAPMDQRMFELACGGVLVGFLRICHILHLPLFDKSVPGGDRTTLDKVALFFRDSCHRELDAAAEESPDLYHPWRLLKNLAIAAVICGVLRTDSIYVSRWESLKREFFTTNAVQFLYAGAGLGLFVAPIVTAIVLICWEAEDLYKSIKTYLGIRASAGWPRRVLGLLVISGFNALMIGMGAVGTWLLMLLMMFLNGWFEQLLGDMGLSYSGNLALYPLDKPCPELMWNDPYLDSILWLG